MIPTLYDGDTVIVQRVDDAESGDLVIALVNGHDATCKRLQKYAEGIALIPQNPVYEPMRFTESEIDTTPVKILGKVLENEKKILRRFLWDYDLEKVLKLPLVLNLM